MPGLHSMKMRFCRLISTTAKITPSRLGRCATMWIPTQRLQKIYNSFAWFKLSKCQISNASQMACIHKVTPAPHQLNMRESRIAADRAARECYGVLRPHIRSHVVQTNADASPLPPLNNITIRRYLREYLPQQFSVPYYFLHDQTVTLLIEEVRALLRLIIESHLPASWFSPLQMFDEEVSEHLTLLLHNQRSRLLIDYYSNSQVVYSYNEAASRHVWVTVISYTAYDNQDGQDLWRAQLHSRIINAMISDPSIDAPPTPAARQIEALIQLLVSERP